MSKPNDTKTDATKTDATIAKPNLCACGCGIPTGKRSDWRQGHDQRAKGWLQRAISGRLFEGERELVTALLERKDAARALRSDAFAPLVAKATAALAAKVAKAS